MKRILFGIVIGVFAASSVLAASAKTTGKTLLVDDKFKTMYAIDSTMRLAGDKASVDFITESIYKPGMAKRQYPLNKELWLTKIVRAYRSITCEGPLLYTLKLEYLTADYVRLRYSEPTLIEEIAPGSPLAILADYYCQDYEPPRKFLSEERNVIDSYDPMTEIKEVSE